MRGQSAKLIVEQFDQGGVRIRREDPNGFTAVYEGSFRGSRVEGTVVATAAFFRKPGIPTGTVHYAWYATIPSTRCTADNSNGSQDWFETGGSAVKFRQMPDAFQCFLQAAQAGNGPSKGLVGLMYRDGIGTQANYVESLRWLKAGAVQGDYNAQLALSQMYEAGTGTEQDAKLAQLWKARAENNPEMLQRRQQEQQQSAAQQQQAQQQQAVQSMMFLGLAAVLEAATRPDVYVVY